MLTNIYYCRLEDINGKPELKFIHFSLILKKICKLHANESKHTIQKL